MSLLLKVRLKEGKIASNFENIYASNWFYDITFDSYLHFQKKLYVYFIRFFQTDAVNPIVDLFARSAVQRAWEVANHR